MTSTGARSSLPSRMTEPFPNCLSMFARATSSAFSRSAGDGIACSFCWCSVASRLSRPPRRVRYDDKAWVPFGVFHGRGGSDILEHPDLPGDRRSLDIRCAGTYGSLEHTFERHADPPPFRETAPACRDSGLDPQSRRADAVSRRRRISDGGGQATDAVAAGIGDVHLGTQSQPDLAWRDAGGQCLGGGAATDTRQHEIAQQRRTAHAELVGDRPLELAATHLAQRQLGSTEATRSSGTTSGTSAVPREPRDGRSLRA